MSEKESTTDKTFSRPATLSDFLDEADIISNKNKYNNDYSHNNSIQKNQQHFGHRKRIKP
jgi:hypothetical protein